METREAIYQQMMKQMDIAYDLMEEYDATPHRYGTETLYQVESHMIEMIGNHEGITITEIAKRVKKSKSACSQMVQKLRSKDWVIQKQNKKNNREYNLFLTKDGWNIFHGHQQIDAKCWQRGLQNIQKFSNEELQLYVKIQKQINRSFAEDVEVSKKEKLHID